MALLPMAPLFSLKPPPHSPRLDLVRGHHPSCLDSVRGLPTAPIHLGHPTSFLPARWKESHSLLQLPSSLQLDGCCFPLACGVPRLAFGLSAPAPSHLTTCDHSPQSHSFTNRAFSLFLWESHLHPGASRLAASCPPYLCPLGPYTQERAATSAPLPSFGVCPS